MRPSSASTILLKEPLPPIESAALVCRQSIQKCLVVEALTHAEWAQNRLTDFSLWTSGLGVFAGPKASLDDRLIHQPDTVAVLTAVLHALAIGFERCQELGLKSDRGEPIDQAQRDESTPLEENADDLPPRSFSPWSDESESASDTEDLWVSSPNYERSPTLSREIHNAETLLDQLIEIGAVIRRSGTVSRLRKADTSFEQGKHQDFRKYLVRKLLVQPSYIEGSRVPEDLSVDYDATTRRLSASQEQLVFANLIRRNRFEYFRRHARKLATPHKPETLATEMYHTHGREIGQRKEHSVDTRHAPTKDTTQGEVRNKMDQKPKKGARTVTTASVVEATALNAIPQRVVAPSQVESTQLSAAAAKLEYPEPPPGARQTMRGFKCPCCCQVLPSTLAAHRKWRKHMEKDLCPYTCLFPDCVEKNHFYATKDAWKTHLKKMHQKILYWECPACDPKEQFPTQDEFAAHSLERHSESISKEHLPMFIETCSFAEPVEISKCPICECTPEGQELHSPDLFLDHIGDCVHEFSLQALPWTKAPKNHDLRVSAGELVKRIDEWFSKWPTEEKGMEHIPNFDLQWPTSDDSDDFIPEEYFAENRDSATNVNQGAVVNLSDTIACYAPFDRMYVQDKFPCLRFEVANRIGSHITRRRQVLLDRQEHQHLSKEGDEASSAQLHHAPPSQPESKPQTLRSKATTFGPGEEQLLQPDFLFAPSVAESISRTSIAASQITQETPIKVPPRPKDLKGTRKTMFECKFCALTIHIESDRAWKKHVLSDLRPYVCTFPECDLGDQMFADRDSWFQHEMQIHRVEYFCNAEAHPTYKDLSEFKDHMQREHDTSLAELSNTAEINTFRRPTNSIGGICDFCLRAHVENIKTHVSKHLEQISLFAIPRADYDEDDSDAEENQSCQEQPDFEKSISLDYEQDSLYDPEDDTGLPREWHPAGHEELKEDTIPDAPDVDWESFLSSSFCCGKVYGSKYTLTRHRRESRTCPHGSGGRRFVCYICANTDQPFSRRASLKQHLQEVHRRSPEEANVEVDTWYGRYGEEKDYPDALGEL